MNNVLLWKKDKFTYHTSYINNFSVTATLSCKSKPDNIFTIGNVHLKGGLRRFVDKRVNQMKTLLETLDHKIPTYICGDFNDDLVPTSQLRQLLEEHFIISHPYITTHVYHKEQGHEYWPFQRIIYNKNNITVHSPIIIRDIPDALEPSDHLPLTYTIHL